MGENDRIMTNKKKILVITAIPVLAAAILAFSLGPSLMNMGNAATVDKCEPKVLGALQKQGFVVKQPSASSLPMGYSLQSVEDNYAIVHLYYADHAICQPNTPTAEWAGGTITLEASDVSGQDSPLQTAADEERMAMQTASNVSNETNGALKAQILDINGHKAVAWDQHAGKDRVITSDGKVLNEEPMNLPAVIQIFDSKDHTMYNISALKPLSQLLPIAQSIPLGE